MKSSVLRLLSYSLHHPKLLISSLLLLLMATAADLLGPWLIKVFIDDYLLADNWQSSDLLLLLTCYIAALLLANWGGYLQSIKYFRLSAKVLQEIRQQSFQHALSLPFDYFHRTPVGDTIARLTSDTEAMRVLFSKLIGSTIKDIVVILGVLIALFSLNHELAMLCLAIIPFFLVVFFFYRKFALTLHRQIRQKSAEINSILNETLQQVFIIQLFNKQATFYDKLSHKVDSYIQLNRKSVRLEALLLRPLLEFTSIILMVLVLLKLGMAPATGIELGVVFAFFSYLSRFFEPMINLMQSQGLLLQSIAASERVFALLDSRAETDLGKLQIKAQGGVQVNQLSFSYGEKPVLNDINFTASKGQFIALVGPTGSGKSTLVKVLKGFYPIEQGEILLDDTPISRLTKNNLRKQIALVEQMPFIRSASLAENIAFGNPDIDELRIMQALQQAQLMDWYHTLEHGLTTQLGPQGLALSAGQKQLISLARALAQQPKVIVLDEASANLDYETEKAIETSLVSLNQEVTLIMIAHKLTNVRNADQILVMDKGKIVERGNHQTLMSKSGLYASLSHAQLLEQQDVA